MNNFKSSPLIDYCVKNKPNRNAKRRQQARKSKQQQYLIPNPFRQCEQENYLPKDLKCQIQDLQYISPNQIQSINFNNASGKRRSSAFNRHLVTMQHAAKKQEEMYKFFTGHSDGRKQTAYTEVMQQQQHINISQHDNISLGMEHCFLRIQDDHDDNQNINFFAQEMEEQNVIFYSQSNIYSSEDINNDYEAYFDV